MDRIHWGRLKSQKPRHVTVDLYASCHEGLHRHLLVLVDEDRLCGLVVERDGEVGVVDVVDSEHKVARAGVQVSVPAAVPERYCCHDEIHPHADRRLWSATRELCLKLASLLCPLIAQKRERRHLTPPSPSQSQDVERLAVRPDYHEFVTADLLPGSEPFSASNGANGVLVLHGFTGSPQSMRPLAEAFADAGLSVDLPLLPGHGTRVEDMIPTRWSDWAAAAESAFHSLAARCDRVVVAGLSMGGTLALWLAESHSEIAGLVLVNPLVEPAAESFCEMMREVLESGVDQIPGIGSDIAQEGQVETAYSTAPIEPLLSLMDAARQVEVNLVAVTCSVLLLSSRADHVVPSSSGDALVAGLAGAVERVYLDRSFHVATLDYDQAEIEERAVQFALKVLAA